MYVLICPCIQRPDLRAKGITRATDLLAFRRAEERCRKFGLDIIPLPCPETIFLGRNREQGTFKERLDSTPFYELLDRLEKEVRGMIEARGSPLCIVGVNSSPACGVDFNFFGNDESGRAVRSPGRGAFLARFPDIAAIDVKQFARYRVYLAAPLFSEAERRFNEALREFLQARFYDVYLPQESGEDGNTRDPSSQQDMFDMHVRALDEADVVVAVVDGADADSGTSWEMGYAYARGKSVIALRTDFRRSGLHEHVNFMLERSAAVVSRMEEIPSAIHGSGKSTDPIPSEGDLS